MNFIRQREKHNRRLPVKAEAHRGWLPRRQRIVTFANATNESVIGNQHFCGLKTSDIVIYVLLKKKVPES